MSLSSVAIFALAILGGQAHRTDDDDDDDDDDIDDDDIDDDYKSRHYPPSPSLALPSSAARPVLSQSMKLLSC